MEANGISSPTSPVITGPTVQPQANSAPPGEKARGVVSKLESGHFKGKGVSDVRLRIAHFDNPDLEPVNPNDLVAPENGPTKAYEKFLEQYRALVEPLSEPDVPAAEILEPELIIEDVVVETPPATEPDSDAIVEPLPVPDVPAAEIPEPELIIEDTVVETPPITEPTPAGESNGALAAFMEILEDNQALKEEAGTLDILT